MARFKYNFWLDDSKKDDRVVAVTIADLKKLRAFSSVLRDGIMIVSELRQGKTDLLFKLYPWIADSLRPAASAPNSDPDDIAERVYQKMNAGGKVVILDSSNDPLVAAPALKGLKPINAPQIAMPVIPDDDQDPIVIRRDDHAAGKGAAAFMDSVLSLQAPTAQ
jgi:hypothetical protein